MQSSLLRVNGVVEESIVDGPGLRYTVFTQGCPHACPGCHNPETHSLDGGYLLDIAEIGKGLKENPLLAGFTFSGGEPFLQVAPLALLAESAQAMGKNVVTYTGYTFELLRKRGKEDPGIARLLELTDILIDGPYVQSLRNLELRFRGSSNQRVLTREDRGSL